MTNFTRKQDLSIAPVPVRLHRADRAALLVHFTSLDIEDRRLRFGIPLKDWALEGYVDRIEFEEDDVFAIQDDAGRILAAIHVARVNDSAELGLSVLPGYRNQGFGTALFERAVMRVRIRGLRSVYVHCLAENDAMMHIARKLGMEIVRSGAETDARLQLPAMDVQTQWLDWLREQQANALQVIRQQARLSRALLGILG
jgi:RimJ/RimL family protein N-acetyltransferase